MQNNARDMHRAIVMFQTMFNLPKSGKITLILSYLFKHLYIFVT